MIEVMRVLSAAAGASGAIFVDDVFFKSGRPWFDVRAFGAVGDGVTDDATAINAALTAANNIGGGTVYLSQGATGVNIYQVNSVLNVVGGVSLIGTNLNTTIRAGGDNQVITMSGRYATIKNLNIIGSKTIGTSKDAVTVQSTTAGGIIDLCNVAGGRYALYSVGDTTAVTRSSFSGSYGDAVVYTTGGHYLRVVVDQQWPANTPSAPLTINAWQANTAYTANTVVSTQGYNIQVKTGGGGTSGGSAPTLQSYGTDITDGTVTWRLVGATTYSGMKVDGSSVVIIRDGDFTGSYTSGILIQNSNTTMIKDPVVGVTINEGIKVWGNVAGSSNGVQIEGGQIANVLSSTGKGIWLYTDGTHVARDVHVSGVLMFANPYGIFGSGPSAGSNWILGSGNRIYGATIAAIHIDGGVTDFNIHGNTLGVSPQFGPANAIGIELGAGATDYFTISSNDLHGAASAISNNLTSAPHGMIVNNIGYNPQAASSIAVGASPFTYTNQDPFAEMVAVYGGTVSSITVRGVTVSQGTNVTPTLYPGDSIVVTYTVTPGMNKIPL